MSGSIPEQFAHHHDAAAPAGLRAAPPLPLLRRPWVVPAAAAGALALALIAAGVIPIASIVYVAPLAGCLLMHVFMGHGGHGGHGGHEQARRVDNGGALRDTPWEYAHPNESVTQLKETAVRNHGNVEPGPLADPVCGMTVDAKQAEAKALTSRHDARDYFFCGRGCKLEFDEDPGRFLDPAHTPSM